MTSHTIRSTIAAKMGKEVPNWLKGVVESLKGEPAKSPVQEIQGYCEISIRKQTLCNEEWRRLQLDKLLEDVHSLLRTEKSYIEFNRKYEPIPRGAYTGVSARIV